MDPILLPLAQKILSKYVSFTQEELEPLLQRVKICTLKKNDFFIDEGQIARSIAFTLKGYLRVYYNHDGEEITRDISPRRSFVTALPSFVSEKPSFEIIKAITDCELLTIQKKDLNFLYDNYPKWERFGRLIMEEMFVESQHRVYSFITHTAEDRYRMLLKEHPDIIREVPLKYIADFIGIKLPSLSRLRKNI
ncbi:MAG: hypothetical protein B7C24_17820 [Bacteroidetes bacterium 4572_77]|nr:MAG: hypothetical protein B7C24_17820 [Bacteroidetes bacterium 4572_77]